MTEFTPYRQFFNGTIHTLEATNPVADTLLTFNDRIVFCGAGADINIPHKLVEKIDLENLHIFPAFTDCHTHVAAVALDKEQVRLDHCTSLAEAIKIVREYADKTSPGNWILGGGWNANIWPEGRPDRYSLDAITQQHPVALYNKDGHTQWLNTLALRESGLENMTSDPPGGRIGRDDAGKPDGLVYENACNIVAEISEVTSYERLNRCMSKLYPDLYRLGITSVHSCEGLDKYNCFNRMQINGELKMRISMQPPAKELKKLSDAAVYSGSGNHWLRMGGLKYFVDGSLGSQTAEMFENYDGTGQKGIEVLTESELLEIVLPAARSGFSATVHAIGDKAIHKTLNVFTKIRDIETPVQLRNRIEHSQILIPEDIKRFADLNLIASMQPMHIADDVRIAEKYLGKRGRYTYPIKSFIDYGCRVVFGSDMPVADPDPIKGIRAAIGRRYNLDRTEPSWQPQECITPEQALHAYTRDAAYASYEEADKGTLTRGKLADFIAVNQNILTSDDAQIEQAQVLKTVMAGKVVYTAGS